MAAKHVLSLDIPNVLNQCILRIVDTSVYDTVLPTVCPTLEITPPGFQDASVLTSLAPNFTANLTACDLGLQTANCDNYNSDLSDGVYIIRWSLSPNDQVYVEYNYLRIATALNKYQEALCCIQRNFGSAPGPDTLKKIQEAMLIKTYLDAAQAEVGFCHHPKDGIATYTYALGLLDKLLCACGCGNCN